MGSPEEEEVGRRRRRRRHEGIDFAGCSTSYLDYVDMSAYQTLADTFAPYVFGAGRLPVRPGRRALLASILAQCMSEHRAIFQIETTLELAHTDHDDFHEHRKRHEEEDDCPEELKAM